MGQPTQNWLFCQPKLFVEDYLLVFWMYHLDDLYRQRLICSLGGHYSTQCQFLEVSVRFCAVFCKENTKFMSSSLMVIIQVDLCQIDKFCHKLNQNTICQIYEDCSKIQNTCFASFEFQKNIFCKSSNLTKSVIIFWVNW